MERPQVYTTIFVTLDSALKWQTAYRLEVRGVRSLGEVQKSPSRGFTTLRQPKVDTSATRAPAARRDAAGRDTVRRDTTQRDSTRRDTLGTVPGVARLRRR
jgi:hypothetical protein